MASGVTCTQEPGTRESAQETPGEGAGLSRAEGPSPTLTRAILQQLVRHGRELGRGEMLDQLGERYGWNRSVSDPWVPATSASPDA